MLFLFGSSLIVSGAHTFQSKEMIVHKYTIHFLLMDSLYTAGNKPLEKYIGALGYAHPGRFMDSVAYLLLQCCVRRTLVCVLQLTASFCHKTYDFKFYLSRVLLLVGHETDELSLSHMTPLIRVMTPFCSHMTCLSSHMTHAYMFHGESS